MAWAFHWRALLQTKGFLKIIEFLLAMLVFCLVAGFSLEGQVQCSPASSLPNTTYRVGYAYSHYYNSSDGGSSAGFNDHRAMSGAQFLVTWGVFTDFYCIIALVVYILFTANENMERVVDLLVYVDLGCHVAWVVGWFIVSVEWIISAKSISNNFYNIMNATADHDHCNVSQDTNVQADIASVFSSLSMFVWGANVYWVFIDTAFFIKWQSQRKAATFDNF